MNDVELGYLLTYLRKNKMTYSQYLSSSHWQEVKKRRLAMPFCYCYVCGWGKNLNIHHNTYANIGNEEMSDLAVLCYIHHKEAHRIAKEMNLSLPEAVEKMRTELAYQHSIQRANKRLRRLTAKTKIKRHKKSRFRRTNAQAS